MTESRSSCNPEHLRLLLAEEIPPEVEAEVTGHIVDCPKCRRMLESFAGDRDWWTEVETCFSEHADAITAGRASHASHASHVSDRFEEASSFAADFAVDFLQPCDQPDTLGRLDDIEILELVGRGGMGVILKGYQRELGRYVAVKLMAPHLAASGSARKRFTREARAAAAIVHPHVMAIHSVNSSGRLPYLVMPCVACESLQQRLDRDGPLELKEILRIGHQVAAGLAAAHAQGLVHRDVKPANILLEKGVDRVMLTDFGLARAADDASLTKTGVIAGTPQYMSPEQARGEAVDHRSDLFSLGSVMYAMCTGRPPFRAETSYGILRRITDYEPRPIRAINPDAPDWLAAIVMQLQEKDTAERFSSADELSTLLERCLAHVQQPTAVELPEEVRNLVKLVPTKRRNCLSDRRTLCLTVCAVATCTLAFAATVGLGLFGWPSAGTTPKRGGPEAPVGELYDSTPAPSPSDGSGDTFSPAVWQDGVEVNIQEMGYGLRAFEDRASRHWESNPVPEE